MTTDCFISVRDVQYTLLYNGYNIVVVTDIPCHLYMRWSLEPPQKHSQAVERRGLYMHTDVYLCFVAYHDNEQEEAGDTLVHTFVKRPWPICETRYFHFWGSVAGAPCRSTTSVFQLHFAIEKPTYLDTPSNRTLRILHVYWNTAHDSPTGDILNIYDDPLYRVVAGALLTVRFWVTRGFLFFDTTTAPPGIEPAGGWLSIFVFAWDCTSSIVYPNLCITQGVQHDPIIPTDFGDQLPYTTIGGQRDIRTLVLNQYNNIDLNEAGKLFINPGGITRLCIRQEMDVLDNIPPLGANQVGWRSHQKGPAFLSILTLCYPPS